MYNIQHFESNGKELRVRDDGYIDATALCKNAGKLFNDWFRLRSTNAFLSELSLDTAIPVSSLVQVKRGAQKGSQEQGSWAHPDVAPNLGQWLSPSYAVWVAKTIRRIHQQQSEQLTQPTLTNSTLEFPYLLLSAQKEQITVSNNNKRDIDLIKGILNNLPIAIDGTKSGHLHKLLSSYGKRIGNYSVGYSKFYDYYRISKYEQLPLRLYDEAMILVTQWHKDLDDQQGNLF